MKKTLNIFGRTVKVVKKKGLYKEESTYGYYDPEKLTIYIDADLKPKIQAETIKHEAGHALFHRAGLCQTSISPDIEQIIVEQFSIMYSENF
jgi:Zn-dependent peptidase ImmA (M78 family)